MHGGYVICCKTSLPGAGKTGNMNPIFFFFSKVEFLSAFCNNFSQPTTN